MKEENKRKVYMLGASIILLVALSVFHYQVRADFSDTVVFRQYLEEYDLLEFLRWRYNTTTGRLILEAMLYIILCLPYPVFATINIIVIFIGVFALKRLLQWSQYQTTIFMLALLLFPMNGMVEVGMQPGCINYIWAFVAGLIALLPIRMVLERKKITLLHYFGFGIAALIACNMEQVAAIVVCFYLIYAVYLLHLRKSHPIIWVQLAIALGAMLFLLLCTGNSVRMEQEILDKWPDFPNLTLGDKIWNGWITTINYIFSIPNKPFFLLSGSLFVWLWFRYRRINLWTFCASLAFFWECGILGVKIIDILFHRNLLESIFAGVLVGHGEANILLAPPIPVYPQIIIYSFLAVIVVIAICGGLFSNPHIGGEICMGLILCAGFATRMTMGFSPTLIASGVRTFLYLHVAFYICAIYYVGSLFDWFSHLKSVKK